MAATWLDFWQQQNEFDDAMSTNYAYFLDRVEQYVTLTPSTRVLDIGSGPANLEDAWHNRVGAMHGLDISKRYNALARAKHANHPTVFFHDLSATDYLNFDAVAGQSFDLIIVMSVVQYYRDPAEIEQLLRTIRDLAAPGARALLCDLIVQEGLLGDMISVLRRSWQEGKLWSTLSLLARLRFSSYYRVRQQHGLLVVPESQWLAMCRKLGLQARFLDEPITMQWERRNLLIQF
ncbi:hypothetical protein GCM10027578_24570 [Spirosoma luteolum]